MPAFSLKINATLLGLILSVYFVLVLNLALVRKLFQIFADLATPNPLFVASIFFFLVAALNIIFVLFTVKYIEKPIFILMLLSASLVNFAMYQYKIIFDPNMIENIFETDTAEATSYFNTSFYLWFFLTGIIPSLLLLKTKIIHAPLHKDILFKAGSILASVALILVIAVFFYKDYASVIRNNLSLRKEVVPTYYIASTVKYLKRTYFHTKIPYQTLGEDAHKTPLARPQLTVFVVGETARAQNYPFNGYPRNTTPYTKDNPNILRFRNTQSCGTATAISVPCMFSHLTHDTYSQLEFQHQDNVTDILKRANIQQIWLDNNSSCKGVCHHIPSITIDRSTTDFCDGETCTDDVFLPLLKEQISRLNHKNGVIYLHIVGSHGPTYFKRAPNRFKKFTPSCDRSDIQNCSDEELLNAYDNTLIFTDYFLNQIINILQNQASEYDSSMIYISDHGESLGEHGLYLHGMPYSIAPDQQTHVPFMIWLSQNLQQDAQLSLACLSQETRKMKTSQDNIFHTLLGVMQVSTAAYDPSRDVLSKCQNSG